MDAELSNKEQSALDAIADYMKKRLYGKVEYKDSVTKKRRADEIPKITKQVYQFWNKCIPEFEKATAKLFCTPDVKLRKHYKTENNPDSEETTPEETLPEEQSLGGDDIFADDNYDGWITPLFVFRKAYDELIYSYGIDSCNQLKKLDKLFAQLCSKVDYYTEHNRKKNRPKGTILGEPGFEYLPYMLDLQEDTIRELLPYLLTAYTLTSCSSRFFFKDRTLVRLICTTGNENSERIHTTEA